MSPCESIQLTVVVENTGKVVSDEVVQVYAHTPDVTVPSPRTRLVAFARVRDIAPGAQVPVTLTVRPDSHAVVLDNNKSVYDADVVVQAGRVVFAVGGSQPTSPGAHSLTATVMVKNSSLVRSC